MMGTSIGLVRCKLSSPLSADPDRELLVLRMALLLWHLPAHLVWHVDANFFRHKRTFLLRDIMALLVGHLSSLGPRDLLARVVRNVLASSFYRRPHLVVACPLPSVLAVLFVLCRTIRLSVRLVLGLELLDADIPVNVLAHLCLFGVALLSNSWPAQVLNQSLTNLLLSLFVLGAPQNDVFRSARHTWRCVSEWILRDLWLVVFVLCCRHRACR